jgi:hypothetical protein
MVPFETDSGADIARHTLELIEMDRAARQVRMAELTTSLFRILVAEDRIIFSSQRVMEMATRLKISPAELQRWLTRNLGVSFETALLPRGRKRGDAQISRILLKDTLRTKAVSLDRTVVQRKIGTWAKTLRATKSEMRWVLEEVYTELVQEAIR